MLIPYVKYFVLKTEINGLLKLRCIDFFFTAILRLLVPVCNFGGLTLCLLVASGDNLCKQFGSRLWPDKTSKLFDTQMVILKEFFEKIDFEKNQQTTKNMKNYSEGKELISGDRVNQLNYQYESSQVEMDLTSFPKGVKYLSRKQTFILPSNLALIIGKSKYMCSSLSTYPKFSPDARSLLLS